MAERLESAFPRTAAPALRAAIISLHTSPTASLGRSANGGLNVYVREVCRSLSELGVGTDVFTRTVDPAGPRVEHIAPLSRVIYLPAGPVDLDKYALVDEVEGFAERVAAFVTARRLGYDVLYSHYWLSGAAACSLRGWLRVPWVHTAHTLGAVKNRQLPPGDRPEPELRLRLEGEISRSADLLVVSTESEGADLRAAYHVPRNRITVVAPGVDVASFRPLDRDWAREQVGHPGERLLLFVGRLERLKGVDVALRAFAPNARRHPDVRLLILGEDSGAAGGEQLRLRQLARDLGIAPMVDFVGSVEHERLPVYYSAAEACLMPSYSESFGLVGLEAQACGAAVVAADVAGLASVVRDEVTGFLVPGHDPADYADRIQRLLDDPELAPRMGRRATVLAQRFTWDRAAGRLQDLFQDLAAQRLVQAGARQE